MSNRSRRDGGGSRREVPTADSEATVKLHKVLAEMGLGSRREMERWIDSGRVEVNGEPAQLGQRVADADRIRVDGKSLRRSSGTVRLLLLNKAEGVICTHHDPEGRPTCFEGLPELRSGRWVGVGRLDINTSGLLLVTNDGSLANRLMHPSTGIDREYAARIDRKLEDAEVSALQEGVLLDGEIARFSDIRYYDGQDRNQWYHLTLMEGRNREVRRLFESQGAHVSRLKRVRYGPFVLPSALRRGRWMEVERDDVAAVYRLLGLPAPKLEPQRRRRDSKNRDVKKPVSVLIPYPSLADTRVRSEPPPSA